jgi:PAS domain S-box-containing protein
MAGFEMAPEALPDDGARLGARLAELEAEVERYRRGQRTSEERFRSLADASPVMILMSDTNALCTYFNRAWLEFRGRTLEEELGNGWTDGLHPDDRDLCVESYLKSFSSRSPFRMQYRLQKADEEFVWVEVAGVPRYRDNGEFAGLMASAAEVSDRKRGFFTPDEDSVRMVLALTERERQVLVLIAEGNSTKQAATTLGISYKTADSHRSRILEKLGVHETASMVRYAIRAGLIEP